MVETLALGSEGNTTQKIVWEMQLLGGRKKSTARALAAI